VSSFELLDNRPHKYYEKYQSLRKQMAPKIAIGTVAIVYYECVDGIMVDQNNQPISPEKLKELGVQPQCGIKQNQAFDNLKYKGPKQASESFVADISTQDEDTHFGRYTNLR
jgi:hypothetical protein